MHTETPFSLWLTIMSLSSFNICCYIFYYFYYYLGNSPATCGRTPSVHQHVDVSLKADPAPRGTNSINNYKSFLYQHFLLKNLSPTRSFHVDGILSNWLLLQIANTLIYCLFNNSNESTVSHLLTCMKKKIISL